MVPSQAVCMVAVCLIVSSEAAFFRNVVGRQANVQQDDATVNPIRKVVSLLQKMADKVQKEAEEEKELYEKFECYCKNEGGNLEVSISSSTAKVPSIQSDIEESTATVAKLKQDLKDHQAALSAAKEAVADATAIREKENAAYVSESTELKGYVTALEAAVKAISGGMAGTKLLQAGAEMAAVKRAVMASTAATEDDQQAVLAFLAGRTSDSLGYIPKSGEVLGILKDMKDNFSKNLKEVEEAEVEAVKTYEDLVASKNKEMNSLRDSIEKKTARVGELQMSIVRMQAELSDTEAALIEDQKFLKQLSQDCDGKQAEFEERIKVRAEELVAIHETIKILNDDDALDLFKKTLPSASLLQMKNKAQRSQQQLLAKVHTIAEALKKNADKLNGPDIRFLEFALMGKKIDFSKIMKMIDNMVNILKQEQAEDDAKQGYCVKQLDFAEDKVKTHSQSVEDIEASIDEHTTSIQSLAEEIKSLQDSIAELDKSVQTATEQRKKENEEYTELMSSNSAAKDLLNFAKNRLAKFYQPKLYSTPEPQSDDSMEFLQVAVRRHHDAPPPAPATWGEYQKQGDSSGVLKMIDLLIRDLDKEMTAASKEEEMSQKAYEELMDDSASKRAKDLKLIGVKESSKSDLEEMLVSAQGDLDSTKKELAATSMYESQLHAECDWLMQNYELRKSARAEESDNLKAAKAVLAGADFSLAQTDRSPRLRK